MELDNNESIEMFLRILLVRGESLMDHLGYWSSGIGFRIGGDGRGGRRASRAAEALASIVVNAKEKLLHCRDLAGIDFTEFAQLLGWKPGRRLVRQWPEAHQSIKMKMNLLYNNKTQSAHLPGQRHTRDPKGRNENQKCDENLGPWRPVEAARFARLRDPRLQKEQIITWDKREKNSWNGKTSFNYQISTAFDDDFSETGDDDDEHSQGWYVFPADHPVDARPRSGHELNIVGEPVEAVKVGDGDALEEGDDEERDVAAKVVKQREDVVARSVDEDQGQDAAQAAQQCCKKKGQSIKRPNI